MKVGKRQPNIRLGLLGTALALLLVLSVLLPATYAIFTSSHSAQRTIAAYDTEGERFSSNYLLKGESRDNVRTIYTTDVNLPAVAAVTVCNYQQGRQTLPFQEALTYTLTATLVRYDESTHRYLAVDSAYLSANGLTDYTVSIATGMVTKTLGASNLTDTFGGAFLADTAGSDAYTVMFSTGFGANKPNLYLEMVAEPSSPRLSTIRGILKPDFRVAGAADYWTGSFQDDSSVTPSAYDGYNYLITGTGSGTMTVSWDSTKVVLSDVSRDRLLAISGATQTGSSITFPVDSDTQSRHDLQFYNVNVTNETWAQMESQVVTFSFG